MGSKTLNYKVKIEGEISDLEKKFDALRKKSEISVATKDNKELDRYFASYEKQLNNLKQKASLPINSSRGFDSLEKDVLKLKNSGEELDRIFRQIGKTISATPEDFWAKEELDIIKKLTNAIKDYDKALKDAKENDEKIGKINEKIDKKNTGISDAKRKRDELQRKKDSLKDPRTLTKEQIKTKETKRDDLSKQNTQLRERLKLLQEEEDILKSRRKKDIDEKGLSPQAAKLQNYKSKKRTGHPAAGMNLKEIQEEQKSIRNTINDTAKEIANIDLELKPPGTDKYLKELKRCDDGIKESSDTITKYEADINELNNQKLSLKIDTKDAAQDLLKAVRATGELGEKFNETNITIEDAQKILEKYANTATGSVLLGLNQLSDGLEDIQNQAEETSGAVSANRQEFERENEAAGQLDGIKSRIQQFVGLQGAVEIARNAMRNAITTIRELDDTMTEMAVVTEHGLGHYWDQLPEHTKRANELGVAINDVYKAETLYYQQGLKTNQVTGMSDETLKMARISGMEAADATNKMTAAIRGFNMELNETSAKRVNDVYSELAAITAADTQEIANAMTKTASIASNAGMEFETTSAFLSQIIETTRESAETAGTAMKTIIARFQELKKAPEEIGEVDGEIVDANKIESALRSVGVALRDGSGQFRELDDVFLELSSKWSGLDKNTQRYIATMAAGSRQQSRFIAMMSDYGRTMELVDAANNSAGTSQEQFEKTLESLSFKITKLKNSWDTFTTTIFDNKLIGGVVDAATKILDTLNEIISKAPDAVQPFLSIGMIMGGMKLGQKAVNSVLGSAGESLGLKNKEDKESKIFGKKAIFSDEADKDGNKVYKGSDKDGIVTHKEIRVQEIRVEVIDEEKSEKIIENINRQQYELLQKKKEDLQITSSQIEAEKELLQQKIKQNDEGLEAIKNNIKNKENDILEDSENIKNIKKDMSAADKQMEQALIVKSNKKLQKQAEQETNASYTETLKQAETDFTEGFNKKTELEQQLDEVNARQKNNRLDLENYKNSLKEAQKHRDEELKEQKIQLDEATLRVKEVEDQIKEIEQQQETLKKEGMADKPVNKNWKDKATPEQRMEELQKRKDEEKKKIAPEKGVAKMNQEQKDALDNLIKEEKLTKDQINLLGEKRVVRLADAAAARDQIKVEEELKWLTTTQKNLQQGGIKGLLTEIGLRATGNVTKTTELGITKGLVSAKLAEAAAWIKANSAMLIGLGVILLIVAAITLLVGGIMKMSEAWEEAGKVEENKLKQLNKSLDEMKNAAQEAKQQLDSIAEDREGLEQLQEKFDGLTKGTKEWRQSLMEINSEVLELLEKYPDLGKYISRGKNGEMQITDEGWNHIYDEQQKAYSSAMSGQIATQMQISEVQSQMSFDKYQTEEYREDKQNQAFWASDEAKEGAVMTGAGAGAVAGAAIGSFIPVIGTLLGGLIGAGVGALGGWITGEVSDNKTAEDVEREHTGGLTSEEFQNMAARMAEAGLDSWDSKGALRAEYEKMGYSADFEDIYEVIDELGTDFDKMATEAQNFNIKQKALADSYAQNIMAQDEYISNSEYGARAAAAVASSFGNISDQIGNRVEEIKSDKEYVDGDGKATDKLIQEYAELTGKTTDEVNALIADSALSVDTMATTLADTEINKKMNEAMLKTTKELERLALKSEQTGDSLDHIINATSQDGSMLTQANVDTMKEALGVKDFKELEDLSDAELDKKINDYLKTENTSLEEIGMSGRSWLENYIKADESFADARQVFKSFGLDFGILENQMAGVADKFSTKLQENALKMTSAGNVEEVASLTEGIMKGLTEEEQTQFMSILSEVDWSSKDAIAGLSEELDNLGIVSNDNIDKIQALENAIMDLADTKFDVSIEDAFSMSDFIQKVEEAGGKAAEFTKEELDRLTKMINVPIKEFTQIGSDAWRYQGGNQDLIGILENERNLLVEGLEKDAAELEELHNRQTENKDKEIVYKKFAETGQVKIDVFDPEKPLEDTYVEAGENLKDILKKELYNAYEKEWRDAINNYQVKSSYYNTSGGISYEEVDPKAISTFDKVGEAANTLTGLYFDDKGKNDLDVKLNQIVTRTNNIVQPKNNKSISYKSIDDNESIQGDASVFAVGLLRNYNIQKEYLEHLNAEELAEEYRVILDENSTILGKSKDVELTYAKLYEEISKEKTVGSTNALKVKDFDYAIDNNQLKEFFEAYATEAQLQLVEGTKTEEQTQKRIEIINSEFAENFETLKKEFMAQENDLKTYWKTLSDSQEIINSFADHELFSKEIAEWKGESFAEIIEQENLEYTLNAVTNSLEGLENAAEYTASALTKMHADDTKKFSNMIAKLENFSKILTEDNRESLEYTTAFSEATNMINAFFGSSLGTDFFGTEDMQEAVEKFVSGSEEGWKAIQDEAAKKGWAELEGRGMSADIITKIKEELSDVEEGEIFKYKDLEIDDTDEKYMDAINQILGAQGFSTVADNTNKTLSVVKYDVSALEKLEEDDDDDDSWQNPWDWLYNKNNEINQLIREREKLERSYQKILEDENSSVEDVLKNRAERIGKLNEQLIEERDKQNTALLQKEEIKTKINDLKFSKYMQINDKGIMEINHRLIEDDVDAGKISAEDGAILEALEAEWDEAHQAEQDAIDTQEEIEDEVKEIKEEGRDELSDLYDQVKEGLIMSYQEEIDALSEINDTIADSQSKMLDKIQEQIDEQRQARKNEKTEQNLEDKRQKLNYLRMDTSGANAVEIAQLEKELGEEEQNYQDSLVDQQLQKLQADNEKAKEQRDKQIQLMNDQLQAYGESQIVWEDVQKILTDAWKSGQGFMTTPAGEFVGMANNIKEMNPIELEDFNKENAITNKMAEAYALQEELTNPKSSEERTNLSTLKNNIKTLETSLTTKLGTTETNLADAVHSVEQAIKYAKEGGDDNPGGSDNSGGNDGDISDITSNLSDIKFTEFGNKHLNDKLNVLKNNKMVANIANSWVDSILNNKKDKEGGLYWIWDYFGLETYEDAEKLAKILEKYYNEKDERYTFSVGSSSFLSPLDDDSNEQSNPYEVQERRYNNDPFWFLRTQIQGTDAAKVDEAKRQYVGAEPDSSIQYMLVKRYAELDRYTITDKTDLQNLKNEAAKQNLSIYEYYTRGFTHEEKLAKAKENSEFDKIGKINLKDNAQIEIATKSNGGFITFDNIDSDTIYRSYSKDQLGNNIQVGEVTYHPDINKTLAFIKSANGKIEGWTDWDKLQEKYAEWTAYATGGLADFTGPAWLDGTKSRPELVLNQQDTQNFIALKDILADVMDSTKSTVTNSTTNGDNYYEIEINVEGINNDYDVEQIADKIKSMIQNDAMYRNVNALQKTSK